MLLDRTVLNNGPGLLPLDKYTGFSTGELLDGTKTMVVARARAQILEKVNASRYPPRPNLRPSMESDRRVGERMTEEKTTQR